MDADEQLWTALGHFRTLVFDQMQADLPALGLHLSVPQSLALTVVAHAGPLTLGALQARLHRSQATTSHLVSQLELRGLVERGDDPADARRSRVQLTRRGRDLLAKLEQARRKAFARVLGRLAKPLRHRLSSVLAETVAALKPEVPS